MGRYVDADGCLSDDDDDAAQYIVEPPTREQQAARIVELEQQLWLLLGDVKARALSCTCGPPLTMHERYHIERAEALLADFQPDDD